MKQVTLLSIALSSFFMINTDVMAAKAKIKVPKISSKSKRKTHYHYVPYSRYRGGKNAYDLPSTDPLVDPKNYCDFECTPSLEPAPQFDALVDAEALYKAVKGPGTSEDPIVDILTRRGMIQRMQISEAYKSKFKGKNVQVDLMNDLSGRFDQSVTALLTPIPFMYAKHLHDEIRDKQTEVETLVEMICSLSDFGIKAVADMYPHVNEGQALNSDIVVDNRNDKFFDMLGTLIRANRTQDPTLVPAKVTADANAIIKAAGGRWGTDPKELNDILSTRNYHHLQQVFVEYQKIAKKDIEEAFRVEFPGKTGAGYVAFAQCIKNRPRFYAERMEKSMKGRGIKDRNMIRMIVTRSEIDLEDIKIEFQKIYKRSLEESVSKQIGGHYRRVLTFLVRG